MKKILLLSLLVTQPLYAEYITNDIVSGCDGMYFYRAIFVPHTETCANGYYLPANALSCTTCPSGYTCNGGTYEWNHDMFQGAEYTTNITNNMNNICASNTPEFFRAVFQPKSITCNPGYYLEENTDSCTICPAGNKCSGGQLTFNETTAQGIESCPNNTPFAPAGSAVCYPHVLHVGDDMVYLSATRRTTPSLNVEVNGIVFYANITPTPTHMSAGSQHYFKTIVNDTEHYICDDSVYSD